MGDRLTLVADAGVVAGRGVALPDGLTMRAMTDADAEALAQLYLGAYHPSPGARSLTEAREEMRATFADEFGQLWRGASPVVVDADGAVLAAVMTATEAPAEWLAPAGPYVIEVFTSYLWRGRGLAGALLAEAARTVVAVGHATVTLRVDPENVGAMRLYGAAGFVGLTETDADALADAREADVGDWRAALRPVVPKPARGGTLGSLDAAAGALNIVAVLAVVGGIATAVGLVVWVGGKVLSAFSDPPPSATPTPTASASASAAP